MTNPNQNSNTSLPSSPRRGLGRRLFFWGFLGGGLLFLLMTAFLISLTLPNLREATPPEISGPHQVAQSKNPSNPSTSTTSRTLSVSAPTSGTQSLSLDDFPHLSPPMRELTQDWLDQHEKMRQAIETQITDPVLRTQALAKLKDGQEKMRAFLNFPREWANLTYAEAWQRQVEDEPSLYFNLVGDTEAERSRFRTTEYPELGRMLLSERMCAFGISSRTGFELSVHYQDWGAAVDNGMNYMYPPEFFQSFQSQGKTYNSWEEETYCWQQLGGPGLVGLTARSYQRALDTGMQDHNSRLYQNLRVLGAPVVDRVAWKTKKMKNQEDLKGRLKRFWFED